VPRSNPAWRARAAKKPKKPRQVPPPIIARRMSFSPLGPEDGV
jgi:hypothetical protein